MLKSSKLFPQIFRRAVLLGLACALVIPTTVGRVGAADKKPAPKLTFPAPQPRLYSLAPSGITKGTSTVVQVRGSYLNTTTAVRVDGKGVTAELVPAAKGKSYSSSLISVKLTADSNAAPGLHELRLVTAGGASNIVRFAIGTLPEKLEVEPNENDTNATRLENLPVAISGVISRGEDRDCYRFKAKKGQKMVFDLCGRGLHPYVSGQRPGWLEGILCLREITSIAPVIDEQAKANNLVAAKTAAVKQLNQSIKNANAVLKKANDAVKAAQKVAKAKAGIAAKAAKKAAVEKATDADKAAAKKANDEKAAADKALAAKVAAAKQATDKVNSLRQTLGKTNAELAAARKQLAEKTEAMNKVAGQATQPGRRIAYSDHSQGRTDPVLVHTFARDGEYVIEVRDDLYRGRADFSYRLTIGELPHVLQAYPAGGKRGSKTEIQLIGVNLGNKNKLAVSIPENSPLDQPIQKNIQTAAGSSNDFSLQVGSDPELLEAEPNDTREKANPVQAPVTVNGIINKPGDFDYYQFKVGKGERLIFSVVSQQLGSPVDSRLDLYDEKGKRLKYNDDAGGFSDSVIDHTFAKEGNYTIRIGSTVGDGGASHVYRLNIHPPRPDFSLTVDPDNPRVSAGGSVALRVIAKRIDGFNGDIVLTVKNAPAGAVVSPATIQAGQVNTVISLTMPESAKPSTVPITIVGTGKQGETALSHEAIPTERARFINAWRYMPSSDLVLSVVPKAPATFSWKTAEVKITAGKIKEIPIVINRAEGFDSAIRLYFENLPPGVWIPTVVIEKGQNEGVVKLRSSSGTRAGLGNAVATGTISANRQSYYQASPALRVQVERPPKKETKKKK